MTHKDEAMAFTENEIAKPETKIEPVLIKLNFQDELLEKEKTASCLPLWEEDPILENPTTVLLLGVPYWEVIHRESM